MRAPHSENTVHCVRAYRGKQNPFVVTAFVWNSRADGAAYLKTLGQRWGRTHYAYFLPMPQQPFNLGELHFLRRSLSLEVLTHECVHAAHEFATRHAFREIEHCPYHIGQDKEECIAYCSGHLTMQLFRLFSADVQMEILLQENTI